jgi:hypothetical protein
MREPESEVDMILTKVPVIVEVVGGMITCTPDPVKVYSDQEVEWVYNRGGHVIEFEDAHPFGKKVHDSHGRPTILSGKHNSASHKDFKYTITVPGAAPLDPVVDADPRKMPRSK